MIKKGEFISENTFSIVENIKGNDVEVRLITGELVKLPLAYVETVCDSASTVKTTEKVTETELLKICLENPAKAMTICFTKVNNDKTKKAYKAELALRTEAVKEDFINNGISALEKALTNPVLDYIPGEERVMVGYHLAVQNDKGHLNFNEDGTTWKFINTQRFKYIIVNNIKYIIK